MNATEDKRSVVTKFTDSRKFMTVTLIETVGLAVNKFFEIGVPAIHLWYGCLGLYAVVLVLWSIEKLARIKYPEE